MIDNTIQSNMLFVQDYSIIYRYKCFHIKYTCDTFNNRVFRQVICIIKKRETHYV